MGLLRGASWRVGVGLGGASWMAGGFAVEAKLRTTPVALLRCRLRVSVFGACKTSTVWGLRRLLARVWG